jgi:hypothetical protein
MLAGAAVLGLGKGAGVAAVMASIVMEELPYQDPGSVTASASRRGPKFDCT